MQIRVGNLSVAGGIQEGMYEADIGDGILHFSGSVCCVKSTESAFYDMKPAFWVDLPLPPCYSTANSVGVLEVEARTNSQRILNLLSISGIVRGYPPSRRNELGALFK